MLCPTRAHPPGSAALPFPLVQHTRCRLTVSAMYCRNLYCLADLREAARLLYCPALTAALDRPHDSAADLNITLTLTHPDAASECLWLAPNGGDGGGNGSSKRHKRHNWQQQQQQAQQAAPELPVHSTALLQRLGAMPHADFAARCPADAARLTAPGVGSTVQLQAQRKTLLVGGRCVAGMEWHGAPTAAALW